MSEPLPAPAFPTMVPSTVLEEINDKVKKGVFGKILQEYTMGEIKLSMYIPSDFAGRVIGKKGAVITNLQRETKARVINALPPVGDSLWIAVSIIGDFKTVFDACKAISDIVEDEVDEVVLEYTINYRKPFFIYGAKKFNIVRQISADTNVRIFFPEFNPKEQAFKEAQPMTLEGNSEDVRRAVLLLEREALMYQYVQAQRTERLAEKETMSIVSGGSRDIKSGRRGVPATKVDVPTRTATTAAAAVPAEEALHKRSETAQDARNNNNNNNNNNNSKQKSKLVDATGIERFITSNDARAGRDATGKPINEVISQPEQKDTEDTTEGTNSASSKINSEAAPAAPREPTVKVEKVINIPTNLVGLLLSKRLKAKNTTINVIQHMTHTIISKILPVGAIAGASGDASEARGGTEEKETAVEGETAAATTSGAGRRRRAVSEEETGGAGAEAGEESDSDSGSDSESEGSESGSESESDDESEGCTTVPAVAEGEAAEAAAEAEGTEGSVPAVELTTEESAAKTALDEQEQLKKLMIAESEKLGFVAFRVVGYHEENVDMVVEALQKIIKGDRIMEVTEQLKVSSRLLKWPPKESTRGERPPRKHRDDHRDEAGKPERPERKERTERRERRDPAAAEEAARLKYGKDFDPERMRSTRPRRKDSPKEGTAAPDGEATPTHAAAVTMIDGVSSKYKGKTPLTKEERDARRLVREAAREAKYSGGGGGGGGNSADPAAANDPAVPTRRFGKGPPRDPTELRPRSAKPSSGKYPPKTSPVGSNP